MQRTSIPNIPTSRSTVRNKSTSRCINWTKAEVLCLVEAHSKVAEQEREKRGFGIPPLSAKARYETIAVAVTSKFPQPGRTGDQCQTKWENINKDYKAIVDYTSSTGSGDYWLMDQSERREAKKRFCYLPVTSDWDIFNAIDSHSSSGRQSAASGIATEDTDDQRLTSQGTTPVRTPESDFESEFDNEVFLDLNATNPVYDVSTVTTPTTTVTTPCRPGPSQRSIQTPVMSGAPPVTVTAPTSRPVTSGAPPTRVTTPTSRAIPSENSAPVFDNPSLNTGKRKRKSLTGNESIISAMDRGTASLVDVLRSQTETSSKLLANDDNRLQVDQQRLNVQENMAEIESRRLALTEQEVADKNRFQVGLLSVLGDLVGAIRETNAHL